MRTTVVLAAGVLFTQLLAAAQNRSTPKAPDCNPATATTANTSANTRSQPDQKQKKAKYDKKAKKAKPTMQPDDPRKSPWAEPRDWNWISSAY